MSPLFHALPFDAHGDPQIRYVVPLGKGVVIPPMLAPGVAVPVLIAAKLDDILRGHGIEFVWRIPHDAIEIWARQGDSHFITALLGGKLRRIVHSVFVYGKSPSDRLHVIDLRQRMSAGLPAWFDPCPFLLPPVKRPKGGGS